MSKSKKTKIHFVSDAESLKKCTKYNRQNKTLFSSTTSPIHRVVTLKEDSKHCYDLAMVVSVIEESLNNRRIPLFEYVSRRSRTKQIVPITVTELYSIAKAVWYYNFRQELLQKNGTIRLSKIVSFVFETIVSERKNQNKQLTDMWKRPMDFDTLFEQFVKENGFQYDGTKWKHVDDSDDDSVAGFFKVPKQWKQKFKDDILNEYTKERERKEHQREKHRHERRRRQQQIQQQKQEREYQKQLYDNWKQNEISELQHENAQIVAQRLRYEKEQRRQALQPKQTPYSIEKERIERQRQQQQQPDYNYFQQPYHYDNVEIESLLQHKSTTEHKLVQEEKKMNSFSDSKKIFKAENKINTLKKEIEDLDMLITKKIHKF